MARSLKDANQELERLHSMYRSMPDHKDQAAVDLADRIQGIEQEIARLKAGGRSSGPAKKRGGIGVTTLLVVAVVLGALAFAAAYFGGQEIQG